MTKKFDFPNNNLPLIGLNGRFLIAKKTGVQRSAYQLFCSIIEQCEGYFNFILFTGYSEKDSPDWKKPHVRVVCSKISLKTTYRNHFWEQFILPYLAHKYKVEILHSPANLSPLLYAGKQIVNIHDLCFLVKPQWFSYSFRFIYSWLVPKIAKNASILLTNSNYSKNDILSLLKVPLARVRLVYWAPENQFFKFSKPYHERNQRIIFVGSLEPRKNLGGLLQAFNLFNQKYPELKVKLTIVGCENKLFAAEKYHLGHFSNNIEFLGYLTDDELANIYGDSLMLVYPSFYEGFGFPPLEAMAAGTPVISSCRSSLPEVSGDAALYIDPENVQEIAQAIEKIFFDKNFAYKLIEIGFSQVQKYSWQKIGKHILGIYQEISGK